jgi:acetyl esterase
MAPPTTSITDSTGYVPTGALDPMAAQIVQFFQADPNWAQLTQRPIAETRAWVRAATPLAGVPEMQHVEDFRIPISGGEIGLRLYRPVAITPALIVWAHGGGFTLGSVDENDDFARALATDSGCSIVSVDYRLAPEHKFPTAVEDLLQATCWVSARVAELAGADVPVWLGGDSAGANLATVVTRKLHRSGACTIAGNILAYPCTDSPDAASLRRFESPFLGLKEVTFFLGQYLPDDAARMDPDFAPLHASHLEVLPPTLIITAEHDIITEQAENYGHKLASHGVPVRIHRHAGMIHGFLTLAAFFAGAAGQAMHQITDFVRTVPNARALR